MTREEYIEFMYNPNNIRNCANCPENNGCASSDCERKLPCGQYNCWVSVHLREERK